MQPPNTQRRLFDSILKRGLDVRRESDVNACPDEATLAAYRDRSLPSSQAARWEEHFSNCARCQAMLAAMARAHTASDSSSGGRSLGRRWELYAAIAAAVAGISIAVGLMRSGNRSGPNALYSFNASNAPAQVPQGPAMMQQAGPQIALNDSANQEKRSPVPPVERPSSDVSGKEFPGSVKLRAGDFQLRYLKRKSEFSARARSILPQKPPEPESEPMAPPSRLGAPPPPHEMARREFAPRVPSGGAAGAPFASSNAVVESAPAAAAIGGLGSASSLGSTSRMISVRTADNVERWRFGPNGTIQHREPNGFWQQQSSGVSSALRAAAAPSPTTCWIVGSAGTILRTIDGEHWQRIDSPTPQDLIAIFATDPSDATVTAADGKQFATTDAGRTWRPL
ncbi:MAG TPA: hypothetical protein VGY99_15280 [Candidatus Binataceae bacterium]|nr:hypothetical protein [Candidatus Binataceae bacterium]